MHMHLSLVLSTEGKLYGNCTLGADNVESDEFRTVSQYSPEKP
jgi:hypothetical protein